MFSMENTFEAMRLILFGKRKTPSSPSTAQSYRRFGGTATLHVISATSPLGLDF